jgi:hypothetical protein
MSFDSQKQKKGRNSFVSKHKMPVYCEICGVERSLRPDKEYVGKKHKKDPYENEGVFICKLCAEEQEF